MNCFAKQLVSKDSTIKETTLNVIGVVGNPEAMELIDPIINCLEDKDANVRAMAAWTIGKMGQKASKLASKK